jgi:hypothetical protein
MIRHTDDWSGNLPVKFNASHFGLARALCRRSALREIPPGQTSS